MRSIQIALAGVFSALALAIPLAFRGTLQFVIPGTGYTATLASHVPVMLSIVAGPSVSGLVGSASTLGFFLTLPPVVGARASTHIVWGVAAALAVKRGMSFPRALFLIALPIHATLEGLVVIPFGYPLQAAFINFAGTAIHHTADSIISIIVLKAAQPLIRSMKLPSASKAETLAFLFAKLVHLKRALSFLAFGAEVHLPSSKTQLLYGSTTSDTGLPIHIWAHSWCVAPLISIKIYELIFSTKSNSLVNHHLYRVIESVPLVFTKLRCSSLWVNLSPKEYVLKSAIA